MRISPSDRNTVHGHQESSFRSLPASARGDVRKDPWCFVRDPKIAEQADRSRELLPFHCGGDVRQHRRVEDDIMLQDHGSTAFPGSGESSTSISSTIAMSITILRWLI